MKSLCERHKRLKRKGRLQAARHWLPKYNGNNVVKGYSKHFGVDKFRAVNELKMLGYEISEEYVKALKASALAHQKRIEKKKREKETGSLEDLWESDEDFCFIAGYTSNGVPYRLTREQYEKEEDSGSERQDDVDLPF